MQKKSNNYRSNTMKNIGDKNQNISQLITQAYSRDIEKPELKAFKYISRCGRKYGFPVVCTIGDKSEAEQLHWAAVLLLDVTGTWPREDIPSRLELEPGTALFNDARQLLENGLGAFAKLS